MNPKNSQAIKDTDIDKVTASRLQEAHISPEYIERFISQLLGDGVHATRAQSFAMGVVGVLHVATLGVHAIGRGLAYAKGLNSKHAVKQIDRLLSNDGIAVWDWFAQWVRFAIGQRTQILVALDWTEFDADDHSTLALYLITSHGRATPLVWKTVLKSSLKNMRTHYEHELIGRLYEILPPTVLVTLLADRGFGYQELFESLESMGWSYAIRFRQGIHVSVDGVTKPAAEWVPKSGHAKMLRDVEMTTKTCPIPAVVVKHQKGMKEAWCIATDRTDLGAAGVVKLYARRFTIEETFRDIKDDRFGMGLSAATIKSPARRDRLLLLAAIAQAILTLLGAAGEKCGMDRMLKTNTVKTRTISLFRQGCIWFDSIPNMPKERLAVLMTAFGEVIAEHELFCDIFGII